MLLLNSFRISETCEGTGRDSHELDAGHRYDMASGTYTRRAIGSHHYGRSRPNRKSVQGHMCLSCQCIQAPDAARSLKPYKTVLILCRLSRQEHGGVQEILVRLDQKSLFHHFRQSAFCTSAQDAPFCPRRGHLTSCFAILASFAPNSCYKSLYR